MTPVPRRVRCLLLLSLASMGWAVSFGLGTQLAALWLADEGWSRRAIGLNQSAYYLGVALTSAFVPLLMRRHARKCVVAGMLLDALTTAAFPWLSHAAWWHALRLLGGAGTALSLLPMETQVNHNAPPGRRARDFAVYAISVALGIGIGLSAGAYFHHSAPRLAFALGGLVTLLATALAAAGTPRACAHKEKEGDRVPLARPAPFLGLGSAWAQGFLEGGTFAFLSLYLLGLGLDREAVSGLVGGLFLGVVLAQLPVGWLADRVGRLGTLLACHAVLLAGLLCVPWCRDVVPLGGWLFVLGACCGALYPLGLALLGERIPPGGLARANAWYLACNCAGSLSGPVVMGVGIDFLGPTALFGTGAVGVLLVVATWALWAALARRPAPGRATPGLIS